MITTDAAANAHRRGAQQYNGEEQLSATLVVGDALGLWRAGLFTREDKNDHGHDVGQHQIDVFAGLNALKLRQKRNAAAIRTENFKECEKQRGSEDVERLPVTEYHNREG